MATTIQREGLPTQEMHDVHRIDHEGAVDADGHILEPPDLWDEYLESKYKDRALRIRLDEDGLEELEIGGERSTMSRRGFPATLGAMGASDLADIQRNPDRTYLHEAPFGSMDPGQRLNVMDAENLDAAIIYTTVGLLWEAELEDPELSQAYTRAYNRWVVDFCRDSGNRLIASAHLSLSDPEAAAAELRRAVNDGAKGCYVAPFTHGAMPLGHPDNDVVFATAQELEVPFAIHPTFEPQWTKGGRMGTWENVKQLRLTASVTASDGVRHQFTTMFWLDRIDAVYGHTFVGTRVPLEMKPSEYFMRQIWISCDPDERTIPSLAERFGYDRFMWASDFPHADHTPEYVHDLNQLVDMFPEKHRQAFIGDNARNLFGI